MPDNYGGGFGQYLPALSHLLGEVESPTQTGQMQNPSFGGQPGQLGSILQSPHVQQLMQQFGINFDPNQIRQSPFLPNSFMQAHPGLGRGLSGAMANVAATPEAPLVSGAGSGMSRAMQGMMGGPELQRQYQIRQMMAPFQAMGAQIPAQEFGRKQQLLDLLTQMEKDRQQMGQSAQQFQQGQARVVPGIGLLHPGQPTDPSLVGQPEHAGSQPLFNLLRGQGQQPFPQRDSGYMQYFDPNALGAQAAATHPERGAGAELKKAQAGTEPSKRDLNKARADQARAGAEKNRRGPGAGKDYAKDYNAAEKEYTKAVAKAKSVAAGMQDKQQAQAYVAEQETQARAALEESKSNIDKQRGDPGASSRGQQGRGLISPGAQQGAPPPAPGGPQAKGGKQGGQQLMQDEAGHVWDTSKNPPVLVKQAGQ